ncbi:MAG: 1-hydroxycarotenoid 3,4-desaturase CrtD [Bacteroidota bacterium]
MKQSQKAVIIGAGIAGMATAARLAAKGYEVSVYEKNNYPGGKLDLLQKDSYTFDTGPSLFTQPELLEELFADCERKLSVHFTYQALKVNTHFFYEDGTTIIAHKDHQLLAQEMQNKLGVAPSVLLSFLHEVKNLYLHIGSIFLNEPIHQLSTWTTNRIPKALQHLKWNYLFQSLHDYHVQQLKEPKLVQLFDRFATYNGSNPYQAPAMLSMIAHLEMNEGSYYPSGGMVSIPNAVYNLCNDLGVQFHFNTPIKKIVVKGDKVTGVEIAGIHVDADVVVSNSDVYFTYKDLLQDKAQADKIRKQERSSSAVIFYWGISKSFPQLHLHNIFFSDHYKEEFDCIFNTRNIHPDPTIYINITSKMEAQHAPAGCENWFVLVNTPAANEQDSKAWAAEVRAHTIQKLSRMLGVDIENLIATEEVLTPALIEQGTGSYLGALYGTNSNTRMAAFMRHSNTSEKYKGLYFAGGTVHPGGGIPLCLRSARLVSEAIA